MGGKGPKSGGKKGPKSKMPGAKPSGGWGSLAQTERRGPQRQGPQTLA